MPLGLTPGKLWGDFEIRMVGRLRPGVSLHQAQAELRAMIPAIDTLMSWKMPNPWGYDAQVVPLANYAVGDVRSKLLILLGAVGFVLLIACSECGEFAVRQGCGTPTRGRRQGRARCGPM